MSETHILGIRHHGPGSARSVLKALQQLQPDVLLVEGPSDANPILPLLLDEAMRPPVALLIYNESDPAQAAYFPFAVFSPEYQAIRFALTNNIPVRLIDLPQRHMIALRKEFEEQAASADPLSELAQAAGYDDAERWWDALVEQRQDSVDVFEAILEGMSALREEFGDETLDPLGTLREAHMRQRICEAEREGFTRIAVVCGAWHAPALLKPELEAADAESLASLEQIPVAATWIPWTYNRLTRQSGYGAGVQSPAWYQYLWETNDTSLLALGWLTKVAQHLRAHDLDASSAQVIDAVCLVETMAGLRDRVLPDLTDLNEAALSVLCHGHEAPMQLIERDLIVGAALGRVPDSVPMMPLQRDFQREVERLKLEISEDEIDLTLDLRDERPRQISRLLFRLILLEIPWGKREEASFFEEFWLLLWNPSLLIQLIEKSAWGSTIFEAAEAFALHRAKGITALPDLTALVHNVLLADLPQAAPRIVQQLENQAAATGEITQLMAALPPLANMLSYGDIRRSPIEALRRIVDGITVRILIGLPSECASLADDAAAAMLDAIIECDLALRVLDNDGLLHDWHELLIHMIDQRGVHGLIRGRCCRILVDADLIDRAETVRQMRLALARVVAPSEAAAWLRGFLKDGGMLLVHDENLLTVLDEWVMTLTIEDFEALLPLIRRTFATFEQPEIRQIGRQISGRPLKPASSASAYDLQRAANVDVTLSDLLGLKGGDPDDA